MQTVPGEDVSCHVIQTGQPYISNDVHNDPRFSQSMLLTKISAVAIGTPYQSNENNRRIMHRENRSFQ